MPTRTGSAFVLYRAVSKQAKHERDKQMSYRMEDRKKGYMGTIVSGTELAQIANKIYALQYKEVEPCKVDNFLLIELAEKTIWDEHKVALVCTEGVGWEQDIYGTIPVPTNVGEYGIYNGRVHISVEVIKACTTGEQVDIAEYVRVFGDRLDNNVHIWQSAMNKPKQLVDNN